MISVGTAPGMMQLTRMRGPSSCANALVSMLVPAFAAL
jgi:CBS-domain-containing membrane protein